ncbi:uncharacterized protein [Diabrotica undecimpunctata]|uniref:uncharacterized protein n=1 Tax=Diabrotica undecimpunctata TaxID=50387 RepID=UPI003B63F7C8
MSSISNSEDQSNEDAAENSSDETKKLNLDLWDESLSPETDEDLPEVLKFSELYEEDNSRDSHVVNEVLMSDLPGEELNISANDNDEDIWPKTEENEQDAQSLKEEGDRETSKRDMSPPKGSLYQKVEANLICEVDKREKSETFASEYNPFKTTADSRKPSANGNDSAFASEHNPFKTTSDNRKPSACVNNSVLDGEYNPFKSTADNRKPSARIKKRKRKNKSNSFHERNPFECNPVSTFASEKIPFTNDRKEILGTNSVVSQRSQFRQETGGRIPSRNEIHLRFDPAEKNPFANDREGSPFTNGNRERSPFTRGARERSHFKSGNRERSPFNSGNRERSSFTSGNRERSPFTRGNRERSPFKSGNRKRNHFKSGNRERSPFTTGNRERSPFTRGNRERSPFKSGNRERNPFKSENRERSPFTTGNRERSPFARGNRERSPFTNRNRERNPFKSGNRERSPFKSGNRERSPFTRGNRERSPVKSGNRERSPFTRGRNPYSTERNQLRPKFDEDNRFGSERSRLPSETGRSTFNSEKNQFRHELNAFNGDINRPESSMEIDDDMKIKTLIVPEGYPIERFAKLEVTVLEALLNRHVEQHGILGLDIEHTNTDEGTCLVVCKDWFTKKWLDKLVPKLKRYNGKSMRTWKIDENPKKLQRNVGATICFSRKCMLPAAVILIQIAAENPGIETKHWLVVNKTPTYIRVFMNESDAVYLEKKYSMKIKAGGQQLKIKLHTPMQMFPG